jgi:hypothetical protein
MALRDALPSLLRAARSFATAGPSGRAHTPRIRFPPRGSATTPHARAGAQLVLSLTRRSVRRAARGLALSRAPSAR